MTKKQVWQIVIMTTLSCSLLFIIEQMFHTTYLWKTASKVALFIFIPIFYITVYLKIPLQTFLNIKHFDIKRLKLGVLLGFGCSFTIVLAYLLLAPFIETELIMTDLQDRLKITPNTYVFIALYITFGNSLLEEFYFRGFIFLQLYRANYRRLGYIFSALLFAIYHIAIFATWFNGWLIALALIGLFVTGLIFNWLNTKSNNFLNSWILHLLADISIVSIGFYLLFY